MKRRQLFAFAAGAAFVVAWSARAQAKLPTVGYLSSNPPDIPSGSSPISRPGSARLVSLRIVTW